MIYTGLPTAEQWITNNAGLTGGYTNSSGTYNSRNLFDRAAQLASQGLGRSSTGPGTREDVYQILSKEFGAGAAANVVYGSGLFGGPVDSTQLDPTGLEPGYTGSGSGGSSIDLVKLAEDYNRQKAQAEAEKTLADMEFTAKGRQIGTSKEAALTGGNEALAQNTAYFNQVSPDAYQSQLENYNQKVATGYQKAKEDLTFQEQQLAQKQQLYNEEYQRSLAQMESDYAAQKEHAYTPGSYSTQEIDPITIMNTLSDFYNQSTARFGPATAETLTKKYADKMGLSKAGKEYYTNPSNLMNWLQQEEDAKKKSQQG